MTFRFLYRLDQAAAQELHPMYRRMLYLLSKKVCVLLQVFHFLQQLDDLIKLFISIRIFLQKNCT